MNMETFLNIESLQQQIEKAAGIILYFYNDDCAPCISLRPKVEKLVEDQFPKMTMAWVNSKSNPDIPAAYGIFANPTILIFFEGKEFKRFSKYVSVDQLAEAIDRYYQLLFNS